VCIRKARYAGYWFLRCESCGYGDVVGPLVVGDVEFEPEPYTEVESEPWHYCPVCGREITSFVDEEES